MLQVTRVGGSGVTEGVAVTPVLGDQQEIVKSIIVRRDITHERQLERQYFQAQKMESVGRLAGGIAHDFNNMLLAIMGNASLALHLGGFDDKVQGLLEEIQKAASRSADLTRQLLAFARKQVVRPRVLDLNTLIEELLRMLHRLIGEDISLIWKPGEDLWHVRVDPSQVDQILVNLCVNARDAIDHQGRIIITTHNVMLDAEDVKARPEMTPGRYVRLVVEDDGTGMNDETMRHIFEPFFTTKPTGQGTGLGLATVYGIVKQNHGFVYAFSRQGRGSAFHIYLPSLDDDTSDDTPAPTLALPVKAQGTILLVEDEPSILKLCQRALGTIGYTVLATTSPFQALTLAQEHLGQLDVLITDIIMPELDGKALAKRLATLYPDLKILFISGYPADVVTQRGMLDADAHFIAKPFTMPELIRQVQALTTTSSS